jgi:predicted nucleic acid-binding Zn ribbon protein
VNPVGDVTATTACPVCGTDFEPEGRQRFCSTGCRKTAWRRTRRAPIEPVVARVDTVYVCPECDARYLGSQRCDDCNTWCRRLGPGGLCPCCDEPVAISDLFHADQLGSIPSSSRRRR